MSNESPPVGFARQREENEARHVEYPPLPEALTVGVYDNHTHLDPSSALHSDDDASIGLDYREHLDRASSVGIRGVVQVGTDVASSQWSAQTAAIEPRMLAAVAIHPNEAAELAERGELDAALAEIDRLAGLPRVVAAGETGLDYYRTESAAGRRAQLASFEAHIEIAKRHGIALQIHDREAHSDVISTLRRLGAPERTVFHCFSGDEEMARVCADEGWYLSFAGNITFKNAQNLRDALAAVPRAQVLVETDAPYLTPVPVRGRPNAPYLIPHTLRAMADYLQTDVSVLAAQVSSNTELVYGDWNAEAVAAPDLEPGELA
ncbi:TatD family hydrolase [Rathayibacter sp. YIM 133350]|uniref:TatD family hydrolase n=1 Tax=Rathayibacter sp. YIM 133350 TaxID=3131992 RepID=UPI00307D2E61